MKVSDLIKFLQQQPQNMEVAIAMYSEYQELDTAAIVIKQLCEKRPDGWIHAERPDKPTVTYLVFPGN